ncbi:MAG: hypothetical protein KAU06_03650 [Candidatus Marinimicrobia bacterium]|nr:hypothetical protein [Candidatus Neomarinimicrobiota bacterium]
MNHPEFVGFLRVNIYDIIGNCYCTCISQPELLSIKKAIKESIKIAKDDSIIVRAFPVNSVEALTKNMKFSIFRDGKGNVVIATPDGSQISGPLKESEMIKQIHDTHQRMGFRKGTKNDKNNQRGRIKPYQKMGGIQG